MYSGEDAGSAFSAGAEAVPEAAVLPQAARENIKHAAASIKTNLFIVLLQIILS